MMEYYVGLDVSLRSCDLCIVDGKGVWPMIEIDDILAHALVPLFDARVALYQHYLELDRRVKQTASRDEICMRLIRP